MTGDVSAERKKVIILDDEPAMVSSLVRRFKDEAKQYEVMGFCSAKPALQELDRGDCLAFITDIMMPDIKGDQILQYIYKKKPQQACIVITGYAVRDKINRIVNIGNAAAVLAKPLKFEKLLSAIEGIEASRG